MILRSQQSRSRFFFSSLVFLPIFILSGCTDSPSASDPAESNNQQPTAKITASLVSTAGETVTLDGSSSSDPDGDTLNFRWEQMEGPSVTLSGVSTATLSFVAPTVSQSTQFTFQLTVDDGDLSSTASVSFQLSPSDTNSDQPNQQPYAMITAPEAATSGQTVTLNGSGSSDPDGDNLSYQWTQTEGASITLSNSSSSTLTFVAPTVSQTTQFSFQLTVSDGALSSSASVSIQVTPQTITNQQPSAKITAPQTATSGQTVTLNGSDSSDPDGGTLSYQWTQTQGPDIVLSNSSSSSLTFVAPEVTQTTQFIFQLTVHDGELFNSASVSMQISPVTDADTGSDTDETNTAQSLRAFPGAEGAGANASGGRDGDLYFVTNLNDSGPGSFREGIDTTPPEGRTIIFKVGGYITLESGIQINRENITIAGQTAPGDGICIRGGTLYIGNRPPRVKGEMLGNNIIMRHIRVRIGGPTQAVDHTDNIWVCSGHDIILDHVSTAWSADEALSASREIKNITVQYSLMLEPLNADNHGLGSIIGGGLTTDYSWHHNIYASCKGRNPRFSSEDPNPGFDLDFRNNVIYNWGHDLGETGNEEEVDVNIINNYYIKGPDSTATWILIGKGNIPVYQSGNLYDSNLNGVADGTDQGWDIFTGDIDKLSTPLDMPPLTTDSAGDAYMKNLALGGAMPWNRDATDKRILTGVYDQTNRIINTIDDVGGWPELVSGTPPEDSDSDGMPDFWELAMGLDPSNPADRKKKDAIGYTMLEGYLNWLADGHAVCDRNGYVDVNLQTLNGGLTFLNYTVASGANGTATLLDDGHTVRFSAVPNYSGLANFTYSAVDPSTGYGFGPESVGVLITGSGSGG